MVHRVSTKVSSPQTPRVSSMAKQEIRPEKHEGPREGDPRASCCGDSETRRSFATQ